MLYFDIVLLLIVHSLPYDLDISQSSWYIHPQVDTLHFHSIFNSLFFPLRESNSYFSQNTANLPNIAAIQQASVPADAHFCACFLDSSSAQRFRYCRAGLRCVCYPRRAALSGRIYNNKLSAELRTTGSEHFARFKTGFKIKKHFGGCGLVAMW